MRRRLLSLYGLKFHPFQPSIPMEALFPVPEVLTFCRRVELSLEHGGYALITGEPGSGKSVALRQLAHHLSGLRDVEVGTICHPQSQVGDFYRELGDIYHVPLSPHNRFGGFKALRERWKEHIHKSLRRPVLLIDESQELPTSVLNELRVLTSERFDSEQLMSIVFAGDTRLPDRFRDPALVALGSRIRRRLTLRYASPEELLGCLSHVLSEAGNGSLMSEGLKRCVVEHSAGNYRVMMRLSDELLTVGAEREQSPLDEQLFLDVFQPKGGKSKGRRQRKG